MQGAWAKDLQVEPDDDVVPAAPSAPVLSSVTATADLAAHVARAAAAKPIASVQLLEHGYSNRTFRVETTAGLTLAVQFATRDQSSAGLQGGLLPLLSGRLPVPEVIACDADGQRFGVPTLVTMWAGGEVLERVLPSLSADDAQTLAAHAVDLLGRMEEFESSVPGFLAGPRLRLIARGKKLADGVRDHVRDRVFHGRSASALPLEVRDKLWDAIDLNAGLLERFESDRTLVHADLTPRNIIVQRGQSGWRISAVLDWEFAGFGSPLLDVGRLLRISDDSGAFVRAVADGFARRRPDLPELWRLAAWLFDSVALSGPLARPRDHPAQSQVRREIEHALSILPTTDIQRYNER